VASALLPLDIEWLEEPLHRGDWQGLRRLRESTPLRIAELHWLHWLIEHGCFDVIQPDVVLVGGLAGIAQLAAEHGVELTPHTWGNGLGLLANSPPGRGRRESLFRVALGSAGMDARRRLAATRTG
jgi:L-alanine-DL-glutamate epimerase-like enolase superfamily enzyme